MNNYLDELVQKITTRADLKGFDDLDRKQRRAIKTNDILGQSFRRAFGIFFGIQGVRSIIQTTRDLDLLQKSIKGLTGSAEDWQYLRQEAYRTGTSLKTIAGSYKNFYSAARGAGFNGNQIQGMFSGLLTAGRGIGASQQQIGSALVALEQMLSKGKVSAEELRKQLGNALPGAVEIAQRAMGVTGAEFEAMMKKGIASAEFVPKFIMQAQKELGKGFNENIKSLDFALVNLNNAWMEFQANILQGKAGEALAEFVKQITDILRSQELLNFIKLIGQGLAFVIKHLREIAILWGFSKFIKLIKYIREVDKAITATRISTGLLDYQTKALMLSYRWLAKGEVALAFGAIRKGIMGAVGATALLASQWGLILAAILIVQDILMGMADPNADTYYNDLIRTSPKDRDIVEDSKNSIGGPVYKDPYAGLTVGDKKKIDDRIRKNIRNKETIISAPTGGAAPIFNTDLRTPDKGYVGELPNLSSAYQSSKTQSNNITINISAPNSQPDTIAQSVEESLANFFNTYKESYA